MLGVLLLDFSCLLPKPTKATKKRFGKRGAFIWNQLPARLNLNWTAKCFPASLDDSLLLYLFSDLLSQIYTCTVTLIDKISFLKCTAFL